eukprot:Rhum_TRINITY_DN13758_c0_g3::Rhum_TRINITY_DN13758_c0_g3_i2::g.63667::m.63667
MLVPPSTSSVHVQGEMGKDPVAEASKRVEAEKNVVQELLTAMKASRDRYVATKVSGEDVVKLMMFRDDVTARFDEERAKLEEEVATLEQRLKSIDVQREILRSTCDKLVGQVGQAQQQQGTKV